MQGVQDFYKNIKKSSFSRSHLFRIFQISDEVKFGDSYLVYAKGMTIPSRKLGTSSELHYRGYSAIIPTVSNMAEGDRTLKLDFYCTQNMDLYSMFQKWTKTYWNEVTKTGIPYKMNNIFHAAVLDSKTKQVMDLKCYGIFPKSVSSISYSFESDKIQTFSVDFVFQYFEISKSEGEERSIFGKILDVLGGAGDITRDVLGGVGEVKNILSEF